MIAIILKYLATLGTALQLSAGIANAKAAPNLSDEKRFEYSYYMAEAAEAHGIDPFLVAAVMWVESDFRNLPVNKTNDRGLMQIHWQKLNPKVGETWLEGLTKKDLMDPRKNIHAGVTELAYVRRFCQRKGHTVDEHHWWAHYLQGVVITSRGVRYGRKVFWRFRKLTRAKPKNNS